MPVRDWFDFRNLSREEQCELVNALRSEGYADAKIRQQFKVSKSTWERWIRVAGMQRRDGEETAGHGATLCWDCKKALGKCSWSYNLTPVKGWEAIKYPPAPYEQGRFAKMPNYRVVRCPEFIEG